MQNVRIAKRNLVKIGSSLRAVGTIVGNIYETRDYNSFTWLIQNRGRSDSNGLNKGKLRNLIKIYEAGEWITQKAIVFVNRDLLIIDGRHTFEVCRIKQLPVRYIIVDDIRFEEKENVKVIDSISRMNQVNTRWNGRDVFKAALVSEPPQKLARWINIQISKHNNSFRWNELYGIITKNVNYLAGRTKGIHITDFNDQDLLEEIKTEEFQNEFDFFTKLILKVVAAERHERILTGIYGVLWFVPDYIINKNKFKKIALSMSIDILKSSKLTNVPDVVKYLIRGYNSEYGESVNYDLLHYRGENTGKGHMIGVTKTL